MNLFVKKSEKVSVDIWAWDDDGKLAASNDEKDIPSGVTAKKLICIFRKPTYRDSNTILSAAEIKNESNLNPIGFNEAVIRNLLLEIQDGEDVHQMTAQKLSDLSPAIARAAVVAVLDKITI